MDVGFCVDCLTAVINEYGTPEIFNTDQGSQFTSDKWIQVLQENGIKISMDCLGRSPQHTEKVCVKMDWFWELNLLLLGVRKC